MNFKDKHEQQIQVFNSLHHIDLNNVAYKYDGSDDEVPSPKMMYSKKKKISEQVNPSKIVTILFSIKK